MFLINYEINQFQFIYTLRDMCKEVVKGIGTRRRVWYGRVKYLRKPWTMGAIDRSQKSLGFTSGLYLIEHIK